MPQDAVHLSRQVADTEAVAADFAQSLTPGTVIALDGDLGAGKTQFVRGLVRGLGGEARLVSSPTYVLLHVYGREPGSTMRLPVFHLDAYRIGGADDLEAVGFSELLEQNGVVVVEWAKRVAELLPLGHLKVEIRADGPTTREIRIICPDQRG